MSGFSATDFGAAKVRRTTAIAAGNVIVPASPASPATSQQPSRNLDKTTRNAANDGVAERRTTLVWPSQPKTAPITGKAAAGTRAHERRWRDASIFFIERRRGDVYKYGSIALCVALWVQVWVMFRM